MGDPFCPIFCPISRTVSSVIHLRCQLIWSRICDTWNEVFNLQKTTAADNILRPVSYMSTPAIGVRFRGRRRERLTADGIWLPSTMFYHYNPRLLLASDFGILSFTFHQRRNVRIPASRNYMALLVILSAYPELKHVSTISILSTQNVPRSIKPYTSSYPGCHTEQFLSILQKMLQWINSFINNNLTCGGLNSQKNNSYRESHTVATKTLG